MSAATSYRPYLIRVTRVPLDPVRREEMRHAGALAEDYRSRSVTVTDFVKVHAHDDAEAIDKARQTTKLVFKGEEARYDESLPSGGYRPLTKEV